jgi:hypothetical protein
LANNTCFLECKEHLFGSMVLLLIQPPRADKNWSCSTCVNVVDDAVKRFGSGGAGPQQLWDFIEQLLYLWWESSVGGGGLRAPGFNKKAVPALENVQPEAACKTCCLKGIMKRLKRVRKSMPSKGVATAASTVKS